MFDIVVLGIRGRVAPFIRFSEWPSGYLSVVYQHCLVEDHCGKTSIEKVSREGFGSKTMAVLTL